MASSRRAGPFARVYGPYINAWSKLGLGGMEHDALLKLCEGIDWGRATPGEVPVVSYGLDRMADELGWTHGQAENTIARLKRKGCLKSCEPGRRGHQASYYLMPGIPWPFMEDGPRRRRGEPGRGPQEMDPRWNC